MRFCVSYKEKTAARCRASCEDFDDVGAQKIAKPEVKHIATKHFLAIV